MKALKRSLASLNASSLLSSSPSSSLTSSSWIHLRTVLYVVNSSSPASCSSSERSRLRSPSSRHKRKQALMPQQWKRLFTLEGRFRDGGVQFLKKVRNRGVDPSIRAEVWPFLLGVYDLKSTKEEREIIRIANRKEYKRLRRQCQRLPECSNGNYVWDRIVGTACNKDNGSSTTDTDNSNSEDVVSVCGSFSNYEDDLEDGETDEVSGKLMEGSNSKNKSRPIANADTYALNSESSDSDDSSEEHGVIQTFPSSEKGREEDGIDLELNQDIQLKPCANENFATWQHIIRRDAVRANPEWLTYSPSHSQASISQERANRAAEAVGLKDFNHLEPCRIFHAARLVAILEAYALHDPEIGYCQGMSDLLSPIISLIAEDHEAFWCFVGFMKKARHNFRLDEIGIRRQLNIVSKIIKCKDSRLYRHLEKLQAEDCFFVYRMAVVMLRRELTFEQTLCLWEVMWADQAASRAGIGKSAWSRIRQQAPPTDDLLLYAIAASVLQRRKLIIEKDTSMDEILRECHGMAGQLDVWKLLDDAHDLVVTLHGKVETSFS